MIYSLIRPQYFGPLFAFLHNHCYHGHYMIDNHIMTWLNDWVNNLCFCLFASVPIPAE